MSHPAPRCTEGYDEEAVFSYLCDDGDNDERRRFEEHLESTGCEACALELRSLTSIVNAVDTWKPRTNRVDRPLWAASRPDRGDEDRQPGFMLRHAWGLGVAATLVAVVVGYVAMRPGPGEAPDRGGRPRAVVPMASSQSPQAAAEERAREQFALGTRYAEGRGVPRDEAEAARRFREAAELGLAEAQFELGNRYAEGRGVPRDEAEAVRWWVEAAGQGLAVAQLELQNR